MPNSVFERRFRFDESFPLAAGWDIDFSLKIRDSGSKIIPEDKIIIKHDYGYDDGETSLMKFISRYKRYGEGDKLVLQKHPKFYDNLSLGVTRQTLVGTATKWGTPSVLNPLISNMEGCLI